MLLLTARYVFVSAVSILRRQLPGPLFAEADEGVRWAPNYSSVLLPFF
jgi:hypothetical protein